MLRLPRSLRGFVLPALLLLLWWAAVRFGWSTSPLLVAPGQVWSAGVEQIVGGELWRALGASLQRDLIGVLVGDAR